MKKSLKISGLFKYNFQDIFYIFTERNIYIVFRIFKRSFLEIKDNFENLEYFQNF